MRGAEFGVRSGCNELDCGSYGAAQDQHLHRGPDGAPMSKVEPRRDERASGPAAGATVAPGPAPRQRLREELIGWAKSLAAAGGVWIVLRPYLIEAVRLPSGGIENTLLRGGF